MYRRIAREKGTNWIVVRTWVPSWTLILGGDVGERRVLAYRANTRYCPCAKPMLFAVYLVATGNSPLDADSGQQHASA